MRSLSVAATGMLAQQLNVEVISNNIANMNTTAFKRQRPEFQDLLYQNVRQIGSQSSDSGTVLPSGIQLGSGVKTASVYRITEQGDLVHSGNNLDAAIQGRGWFKIQMPDGTEAFTRAGAFSRSAEGQIVTVDGYVVAPGINIPPDATSVTVNESGQVQVKIAGQVAPQNVGQFELNVFPNDSGLEGIGDNLFLETPASGSALTGIAGAAGFGSLLQGFLETSNVNAVAEITSLITAQRAYELNSKVITTSDEMMSAVNQMR
ncbi:MAG: flagellar basal-body rod protein FlgG [Rhodospirillaceae bacterium]|jgi:flagellar basal-body rod protein FlgG|nr:flagellar basal-body rod protein FlgG [Rhodospirillaceae bacterium]MBT4428824.1 flagellar basal-body rod protein FlgG [Rhodospirillaceae bacterium]MBT6829578.1 flagellar basal-body rod protein FlgG [Rhodospirillaceae bacterium]MBT7293222.1 flagellar basal-body rod protein FlgG [Rhodospirillaceae bacterium]